jgi:hypothetical protein
VEQKTNEVELVILVTPELVDAMDAHEVPSCGPGMRTTSPDDFDLYLKGHLEVPNCCPPGCDQGAPCEGAADGVMPREGMIIEGREQMQLTGQAGTAKPANRRNRYTLSRPSNQPADSRRAGKKTQPGLIGPIGYDVLE